MFVNIFLMFFIKLLIFFAKEKSGRSIPDRMLVPIIDDSATVTFYLISDKNIASKYKV